MEEIVEDMQEDIEQKGVDMENMEEAAVHL